VVSGAVEFDFDVDAAQRPRLSWIDPIQVSLTPASWQIRNTRSAGYPVRSTISSWVSPDMAAPTIAWASPVPRFDEFVLGVGVAVDGLA
jgi:hypothetical protein